uniref:Cysteine-rich transmembrane CYSTM domain-containing protein n=1 Tax=Cannabis sativa TaxID=3483 RepID=A0A803R1M8_CANSA
MSCAQPSVSCYPAGEDPYVAPPPVGYPTMDTSAAVGQPENKIETQSKGGCCFLKALCQCCCSALGIDLDCCCCCCCCDD